MLGETARMAVELNLTGNFNKGISQAQKSLGTFQKQTTGFRASLSNLGREAKGSILTGVGLGAGITGWTLLAGGIEKAIDIGLDAVRMAAAEEAGIAQLTQAIKENDAAWDGNIRAVEDLIDARKRLAFDDADQRESLRLLVAYTHDLSEAENVLGVAMNFARLRGIDLRTASDVLGKAIAGNTSLLGRYGIVIRRGASATEILAQVQKMAAGQAEAYANTTEGKLVRSQIALNDAMEDLGAALTPVVAMLADAAADTIPKATAAIATLAEGVGKAWQAFQDLGQKVNDVFGRDVVNDFANFVRIVGTGGLTLVSDGAGKLGFAAEDAGRALTDLTGTGTAAATVFQRLGQGIVATTTAVEDLGSESTILSDAILDVSRTVISNVRKMAGGAMDGIRQIAEAFDTGKGAFHDFQRSIIAGQRRIKNLIADPGQFKRNVKAIEDGLRWLERQKDKLLRDGIQRRDYIALAAIEAEKRRLTGQMQGFRAIGIMGGNAFEQGLEQGFDPNLISAAAQAVRDAIRAATNIWGNFDLAPKQGRVTSPNQRSTDVSPYADTKGHRATGGMVSPYSTVLVGENGPEVLRMGGAMGDVAPVGGTGVSVSVGVRLSAFQVNREIGRIQTTRRAGAGVL